MTGVAVALLGLFTLGSGGCFHGFKHPLGPEKKAVLDAALLAVWECKADEDKKPVRLTIMDYDGRQYVMDGVVEGEAPGHLRAYSTRVGTRVFLNTYELEAAVAKPEWQFVEYVLLAPGKLSLRWVDPSPFEKVSESARDVRRLLERNLDNPEFFMSTWSCVTPPPEPEGGCE